ncbi:MAG: hypothetical protein JW993_19145 [Sedimentisphaerales bacterium]|nr:hypothetical protein [Sedimentisphaerales bacterium]
MSKIGPIYPVDIVLAPEWWHRHTGLTFDRDFFYHPARRVEAEAKMERVLYERWGQHGLGSKESRPEVGPIHLAAGYLLQEMLGCRVEYRDGHPPQVIPAHQERLRVDPDAAFASKAFKTFEMLCDHLEQRHGYVTGDVNFAGILNIALDLRGQDLFIDMYTDPEHVRREFAKIAQVITRFVDFVMARTGTSSISVNRNVRHLREPVVLHSECTHTMISERDYERFLLEYDVQWSRRYPAFGVHYCGPDPHRYAASYARIPSLHFVDVGAGGDVGVMRDHLPATFLNLRLDPVRLREQSPERIKQMIGELAQASRDPTLTGICCINMDDTVTDERIDAIFEAVGNLRPDAKAGGA